MQFCAICSVASTRSLKRISIAIPPSSSEINSCRKGYSKGHLKSRESDRFNKQIAFKLHHKTSRHSKLMSYLLKHFIRKIKITVNRRFDVSNIILKIEVVYANVKVVMRELNILNM